MKTKDIIKHLEPNSGGARRPNRTGNVAVDRFATALWVGREIKDWVEKGQTKYRQHTTWTVTIEESDTAYVIVQQWLLDSMPQTQQKNVTAATKTVYLNTDGTEDSNRGFDDMFSDGSGKISETRVVLSLAETRLQDIDVDGHKVQVQVTNQSTGEDLDPARVRSTRSSSVRNGRVVFRCRSIAAQTAVVGLLNQMVGGRNKRKPSLWIADGWGQWRQQDAPARKLSSVILKDGLKENIMADLQKFLDDEKKYTDLGIPYHRGYIFHGPAGTGKTSLIKALAADMGLDLWYAPLGDLKEDSSLADLVRSVRARGILLLEDVDSYSAARDRQSDGEAGTGISTSALLNALDGVITPHGLITIMTTNHLDRLDPALVRNGRADRTIELGLPSSEEIGRMWALFFPHENNWVSGEMDESEVPGLSQATVSEVFKRNWDEPSRARKELLEELETSRAASE